jgi:hypothetical protein
VFKQVIDAYSQIAETLPRFDRLSEAFSLNPEFQQVVAVFYADIVRFHKEAYKLVKRNGEKYPKLTTQGYSANLS